MTCKPSFKYSYKSNISKTVHLTDSYLILSLSGAWSTLPLSLSPSSAQQVKIHGNSPVQECSIAFSTFSTHFGLEQIDNCSTKPKIHSYLLLLLENSNDNLQKKRKNCKCFHSFACCHKSVNCLHFHHETSQKKTISTKHQTDM